MDFDLKNRYQPRLRLRTTHFLFKTAKIKAIVVALEVGLATEVYRSRMCLCKCEIRILKKILRQVWDLNTVHANYTDKVYVHEVKRMKPWMQGFSKIPSSI